jgi:hypothetical protein
VQPHTHATKHGYAMQGEANPRTPNPHTGRKAGLNHPSRGLGKAAYQGPASGLRRDVRPRRTQGRVAPAQGNAKLPGRPRDESGLREARPACLNGLVSQVAEQRQGRGPKAPEGPNRHQQEVQGGRHLPIHAPGQRPQTRGREQHPQRRMQRFIVLERGTRDTPNSMGTRRKRAEAKHKRTQATQDTLTRDRPQTHPHKSAKATRKQATADNLRPPRSRDKRGRATGPGQTS